MRIIVAPDSFKEALTAAQASAAMAAGLRDADPASTVFREIDEVPVADGGEGTVDAWGGALALPGHTTTVEGPYGEPVSAGWLSDGDTAVVELAQAAGMHLVPVAGPRIWEAGTTGVGQLLTAALATGATTVVVGLGGSATNDGGLGMAAALGVTAVDGDGRPVSRDAAGLRRVARLVGTPDDRWATTRMIVAGDVDNPLCGPQGAAAVFARQKGAAPRDLPLLDTALAHWAEVLTSWSGTPVPTVRDTPGAGAAGGVGAALAVLLGAEMRSGADLLLELIDFRGRCGQADLVLTGEGRIDRQTAHGKAPARVAAAARDAGAPVIAFGGIVVDGAGIDGAGGTPLFDETVQISDPGKSREENLADAASDLRRAVATWAAGFLAGRDVRR